MFSPRRTVGRIVALSLGTVCAVAATPVTTALAAPVAPAAAQTCFGRTATIIGQPGQSTINGTSHDDVIVSTRGGAIINGNGGNDRICARGAVSISTTGGNDFISSLDAGTGGFNASGGGNDTITIDAGRIQAGTGNDTVTVPSGSRGVVVDTSDGDDTIRTNNGVRDEIFAGAGVDNCFVDSLDVVGNDCIIRR
ncbi:hypothetical protein [Staphylococcus capitis]|uniref:hypothetical protein n=1 Tax=Staphylococcus capitis TaxID=29388 RepID=UPI003D0556A6